MEKTIEITDNIIQKYEALIENSIMEFVKEHKERNDNCEIFLNGIDLEFLSLPKTLEYVFSRSTEDGFESIYTLRYNEVDYKITKYYGYGSNSIHILVL